MKHKKAINLDVNASYGLLPEVEESIRIFDTRYLNPSSIHTGGQLARALIEEARNELKSFLNINQGWKIVFTSGATEANNWVFSLSQASSQVISSKIEHPCVLESLKRLESLGSKITLLEAQNDSKLLESFSKALTSDCKLASFMLANNETGQILPLSQLVKIAKEYNPNILIYCDAVQAFGKYIFDINDLGVDIISLSGHKLGALTGVGALIYKDHLNIAPYLVGGPQETSMRAGTENVLGIHSLGVAARCHKQAINQNILKLRELKTYFKNLLLEIRIVKFNSFGEEELPNTINLRFDGIKADDLVVSLDLAGIYVSSGSACASGKPLPSHVLLAQGLNEKQARESLRISFRPELSFQEIDYTINVLRTALKNISGVSV